MFDDRIVFETPGKLPGIVRTDNIRHTHFSRNPKIAEYLKAYDYVKEFGEGVDRMCRELTAIGTREPLYSLVAFIMKATVFATSVVEDMDDERSALIQVHSVVQRQDKGKTGARLGQDFILETIKDNPRISISQLAKECSLSVKATRRIVDGLREKGLLQRVGPDFGGHWEVINPQSQDGGTEEVN